MKLGKLPHRHDPRTLRLGRYFPARAAVPPCPDEWAWGEGATWGMHGNDRVGDCVLASFGHFVQCATRQTLGKEVTFRPEDVVGVYSQITGYDPSKTDATGFNPTDRGTVALDALKWIKRNGFLGHEIAGYAYVDPRDEWEVRQAGWMFGGVWGGFALPRNVFHQERWEVEQPLEGDSAWGGAGGHMMYLRGVGVREARFVTWARDRAMTRAWFATYCDEAWVIILKDWIAAATQRCPAGFDLDTLLFDLARIS